MEFLVVASDPVSLGRAHLLIIITIIIVVVLI